MASKLAAAAQDKLRRATGSTKGGDSKYFSSTANKGELHEIKEELNSNKEERKKEAVKKVIAAMTVGKDVSLLFTDVLNCIQTKNLELKKLVYLYVMNYAKSHPDRVVLAVNTFQKDAGDTSNPLVRALAIRTMGCIRVEQIAEHLCLPLQNALKDQDPYVRKTAAICVAKLYDLNAELVESQGFVETLNELLSDANPMVVANAVAALVEIDESSEKRLFQITAANLSKLQAALNQCTEWGQVFILNALAKYRPKNATQAAQICERIVPRLNHANSAVVLAAVRVVMMYLSMIKKAETVQQLERKLAPTLVTLLSKESEIQYVALRNINLICQKNRQILAHELKVFFCKYNDPIYVKMEKLELIIMLVNADNIDQVLLELKEYATEVDVEFVRKSVRAIGRCAISIESGAKRCISVLLDLIGTKVNYVVQEAIIVIKDIFRRYPNQYESIIADLCENLETLDEPEAKAAMIWIVGEYAERIDDADELLEQFAETFADETPAVQLALLTAVVKLFLKRPKNTQELVKVVLDAATEKSDNPDLRDRGFVYWRLLSTDPEAAKAVVLADKPLIEDTSCAYDATLLDTLIENIGTLASVYHKPPELFVSKLKGRRTRRVFSGADGDGGGDDDESSLDEEDDDDDDESSSAAAANNASSGDAGLGALGLIDLGGAPDAAATSSAPKQLVVSAEQGNGLALAVAFDQRGGKLYLDLFVQNSSPAPLSQFMVQLNKNAYRLAPANVVVDGLTVAPGAQGVAAVELTQSGAPLDAGAPLTPFVQLALKSSAGVVKATATCPLNVLFSASPSAKLEKGAYVKLWKSIAATNEKVHELAGCATADVSAVSARLNANRLFEVVRRKSPSGEDLAYYSCQTLDGAVLLVEITLRASLKHRVALKTERIELEKVFMHALNALLKQQ